MKSERNFVLWGTEETMSKDSQDLWSTTWGEDDTKDCEYDDVMVLL